jgi:23S rRNA pseudouridine2605 synthase
MRLNKYIAQAGVASRRKADELIANGNVKINGQTVREMGVDVKEEDQVEVNGRPIKAAKKFVTVMLNKPKGYITSMADEKGRPMVSELISDIEERLFPVGRLDFNTSGLLLMTNDGELAHHLMHPQHKVYKTYRARVSGYLSNEKVAKLAKGIDIGGFVTSPARVSVIKQGERSAIVEIQIYEGRNRQVRKMFAAVGNKVMELERIAIGDVRLAHLKEGHYRKLTPKEVEYLKNS